MMRSSSAAYFRDVIENRRGGASAMLLRAGLRLAVPFYAMGVGLRNWMYDVRLLESHGAPRPAVCVGNITTGGTGKTPVARWLADQLRRRGHRPAVLMRGYKSHAKFGSDERRLLERLLRDDSLPNIPTIADPDRIAGARRAIHLDPKIDLLILDDGFQHRRLRRDFDLVLIDVTSPFGDGHLLPRGMLREPLRGLRRANAILLTHTESVEPAQLKHIEQRIREHNPWVPLYRARHVLSSMISQSGEARPLDVRGRRLVAFCGIGNPEGFAAQLQAAGAQLAARQWFADHHGYEPSDLTALEESAGKAAAEALITTEKDWIKLESIAVNRAATLPIWRVQLEIEFDEGDAQKLLDQIEAAIAGSGSRRGAAAAPGAG